MDAETLLSRLTKDEKVDFAETFIAEFLRGGFGAMAKREIEVLVFFALERSQGFARMSFYERANALRILERKVKSLKAESTQRYAQLDNKAAIRELAIGVARDKTIPVSYESGRVIMVIENPALRRELEHALKQGGGRVDYSLNADNVSVDVAAFIQLLKRTIALGDEDLAKHLAEGVTDTKAAQKILTKELPLVDRIKAYLEDKKGAASAVASIFKGLTSAVAMAG